MTSIGIWIEPSVDSRLRRRLPKLPMHDRCTSAAGAEFDDACLMTSENGKVHIPLLSFC